jgi:hypothetical protein
VGGRAISVRSLYQEEHLGNAAAVQISLNQPETALSAIKGLINQKWLNQPEETA